MRGEEALASLRKQGKYRDVVRPDLILLDLNLPIKDGREVLAEIKADDDLKRIPLVILTTSKAEEHILKSYNLHANCYITKPVDLDQFCTVVKSLEDRKFNEELEERVRQRTAELEAANRELKAFSYSVSHNLRAPLRHIDGFSRILLEAYASQIDSGGQSYLRRIRQAVHHMAAIIDGLLALARYGRQSLTLRTVSLDGLLDRVLARLNEENKNRQIVWKRGPLPSVQCDEVLMEQVFANLLGNSLKYHARP